MGGDFIPPCWFSLNNSEFDNSDLILTNRKYLFQLANTFETGLSDRHKLICAVVKSGGFKRAPIEKIYRSCKTFDVDQFQEILKIKLEDLESKRYGDFETVFWKKLNKHAPLKKFLKEQKIFLKILESK